MKTDILIIGGGPAGVVAAVTARRNNPAKEIILVRDKDKSVIPCGIPYIFNRLDSVEKDLMPDAPLEKSKVDLLIDKAESINVQEKEVALEGGKKINYDKLILAVGSEPILVPIKGIEKKGVWQVKKDFDYLEKLRQAALKAKDAVIIGGGFIGVEIAEELSGLEGMNISVIEKLDHCLITTLDREFAEAAEEKLRERRVKIYTGRTVEEIGGGDKAECVKLDNGERIPADLVILSIGSKPNISLAEKAGLEVKERGGIKVDEYMRTSAPDVFAVGDCAETRDFFTGKYVPVMLASTAATEARIAGANLYQLETLRENKGTLGSFATCIGGLALGATGFTESRAKAEGFEVVVGASECPDCHPGSLPGARNVKIKLVFSKKSGALLGAQAMGPKSAGELINLLALAIQQKMTAHDLNTLQIATHPLLTAAPTVYPVITAAQTALESC